MVAGAARQRREVLPQLDPAAAKGADDDDDGMVRIGDSSRARRKIIKGHLQSNQSFFGRHLVAIVVLSLVFLAVCAYAFVYSVEERNGQVEMKAMGAHSASLITAARKPFLLYGTAWKKENTAKFVAQAVESGFRFIDTACQPKHYNEPGVGEGWTAGAEHVGLKREDLFLQTKYTPIGGQDPNNIPYDETAPIEDQVKQSMEVSLRNLKTDYLDSWVMHSPFATVEETMVAWRAMESFVDEGKALRLGMSNCYDLNKFSTIYEMARIKPSVLQNRFYAESNFDTDLRAFCKEKGIWYQSFWTLTANRHALATQEAIEWAQAKGLPSAQTLMFSFLMTLGYVTPLSGTTNEEHMKEDVAIMERMQNGETFFEDEEEVRKFAKLLGMPDL